MGSGTGICIVPTLMAAKAFHILSKSFASNHSSLCLVITKTICKGMAQLALRGDKAMWAI